MLSRLLLSVLAAVAVTFAASAQREYSPNLSVGAKAGATISQMSFSPKVHQSMLPGFMAGGVVRYTEERLFGIVGELNIEQRGWRDKPVAGIASQGSRTLTYVQIPLLTHIRFGSPRFKGFVNFGPEFGFMIASHISGTLANYHVAADVSNRFDYGISGGIGVEMALTPRQSVMLEGRYYYGLGNIFPSSKKDYFSASRGMSIEVTAAWLFRVR